MTEDLNNRIAFLEAELSQLSSQNAALGALLEKTNNQVYTIYNISKIIASTHDFPEMIRQIVAIVTKAMSVDRVTLFLAAEDRETMDLVYSCGLSAAPATRIGIGEGLPGRILEIGEHAHIHDLSLFYETFSDFIHLPGETKREGAYIGVALKSQNAIIGVMGIDTPEKFGLTVDDMDFMTMISHQISAGIEKAKLFEKTNQLSQLDGLTGLYNHRMFREKLGQELQRRTRTGHPLSLVMLDIDHFKRINDTFGHQEGDKVLQELATIMKNHCRHMTMDSCFRYGGEEFVILLPELSLAGAVQVAERLRRAVEVHPFSLKKLQPDAATTISLGVATLLPGEDLRPEDFLKIADQALYRSKTGGRNKVSFPTEGTG